MLLLLIIFEYLFKLLDDFNQITYYDWKWLTIVIKIVEEARIRAEKEEVERKEQEKREAAEQLLRENEVREW